METPKKAKNWNKNSQKMLKIDKMIFNDFILANNPGKNFWDLHPDEISIKTDPDFEIKYHVSHTIYIQ
jgi:hypothetical protein